jgi:hypothetical protein
VGLIQANVGDLHDRLLFGVHGRGKYIDGFGRVIALAAKIHTLLLSVIVLSL